jgi:signal transduction histidine kinase
MCVPILSPERLIGVIYVDHDKRVMDVTKTDLKILEALADHASVAIENATLSERMLLAERVSTVGRMVSSIVHDIRGPLTGIRAAAELIASDAGRAKAPRLTSMIIAEVDRMSGMAQEILDFCRGRQDLHTAPADLAAFLRETIEPLRDALESRQVGLNLDLAAVGTVTMDASRMGRVLRNLVDNAVDAMPQGGVLTISARLSKDQAVVRVSDTGLGMTEEIRGKIFEPFFTHGKKNGNGLGMAIASRIVESHGGRVEVESAPGEGTTIRLTLPLHPGPKVSDQHETVPVAAAAR